MGSKITLKNDTTEEFTVEHLNGAGAIKLYGNKIQSQTDTIATLKAMVQTPSTIYVTGYTTADDGAFGSHFFKWNSASVETDNGGTVIKLDGIVTGRYELQYDGAVNVKWFGAVGDGEKDDTLAIQKTINSALPTQSIVNFSSGIFKVTDTIIVYTGTQIEGNILGGYTAWAGALSEIDASTIKFVPTSAKTLFKLEEYDTSFSFKGQCSISNIRLFGDGTLNSLKGMDLTFSYYNRFNNIIISDFVIGIYAHATINNRFENLVITKCDVCVDTGTTATTDVYDHCAFNQSRIGIKSRGTVGIRVTNCLTEQLDDYGFDISAEDATFTIDNLYSEDVPYATTVANPCVIRVGGAGISNKSSVQLLGSNLILRGKNSDTIGSAFYINGSDGIQLSNVFARKFITIIETTASVRDTSININGLSATTYTTLIDNNSKVTGDYYRSKLSDNNLQKVSNSDIYYSASFRERTTSSTMSIGSGSANIQMGGIVYPTSDNTKVLGLSNLRWSVIYAGTATINTSDERTKTELLTIDDIEKLVAIDLKASIRKFKFIDSVDEKGDNARIHFGVGAQTVRDIFENHGLIAEDYALFCYDEFEDVTDSDGNILSLAGNRYGIRYSELLAFIISAM